jgi:hypothetical protein
MGKTFKVGDRVYIKHLTNNERVWSNVVGTVCEYSIGNKIIALDHAYGKKPTFKDPRTDSTQSIWFVTEEHDPDVWERVDKVVKGEVKYLINWDLGGVPEDKLKRPKKNTALARKLHPKADISDCKEWIYV